MSKFKIKYRLKIVDLIQPTDLDYFHWKVTSDGQLVIGMYPYFDVDEDHKGKFLKSEELTSCPWGALAGEIYTAKIDADLEPISLKNWFSGLYCLTSLINFSKINVSKVTSFEDLFSGCARLTNLSDIADWDVSNVTSCKNMFSNCLALGTVSQLDSWKTKTGKITDLSYMFNDCANLIDMSAITNWNVSKVTNVEGLFKDCTSLDTITFNWNSIERPITDISYLFQNCTSLTSIVGLTTYVNDTVEKMNYTFDGCLTNTVSNVTILFTCPVLTEAKGAFKNLDKGRSVASDTILDLTTWKATKLTYVDEMFKNSNLLEMIRVTDNWQAHYNEDMVEANDTFAGCNKLANKTKSIVYTDARTGSNMLNYFTGYLEFKSDIGVIYLTMHEITETDPDGTLETYNQIILSSSNIDDGYKTWPDLHNILLAKNVSGIFQQYSKAAYLKNTKDTKQVIILNDIYPEGTIINWFGTQMLDSDNAHLNFKPDTTNYWPQPFPNLDKFHTDYVTNLEALFKDVHQEFIDLSNWNTKEVVSLSDIFFNSIAKTIIMPIDDTLNYSNITDIKNAFRQATVHDMLKWTTTFNTSVNATMAFSEYTGPISKVIMRFNTHANLTKMFYNAVLNGYSITTGIGDVDYGTVSIDIGSGTRQNILTLISTFEGLKMRNPANGKTDGIMQYLLLATSHGFTTPVNADKAFSSKQIEKIKIRELSWDTKLYPYPDDTYPFLNALKLTNYDSEHVKFADWNRYIETA